MKYNMNCFGITGFTESLHASTRLCQQQEGIIVLLCYCCLWIRRTKRQQNKQNVMFIQILIRVKSSGWHCLCTTSSTGLPASEGSRAVPLSRLFKAWNSLFESFIKARSTPNSQDLVSESLPILINLSLRIPEVLGYFQTTAASW